MSSDQIQENQTGRMRLARFMAMADVASRRKCEELIQEGRVSVNGSAVLTPACTLDPEKDTVTLDGKTLRVEKKVYLMLNKPAGYTCSAMDVHAEKLIYELLPKKFGRIFSVGRLDRDSEGLLVLTNDGELAQKISHPSRRIEKAYLVDCEGSVSGDQKRQMLEGVKDEGEFLKPVRVTEKRYLRSHTELEIILQDGRKREVRRICAAVGLEINSLTRTRYGRLELGNLPSGHWRLLTEGEIQLLQKNSSDDEVRGGGIVSRRKGNHPGDRLRQQSR